MSANLLTIGKTDYIESNITIKFTDGYDVPDQFLVNTVQNFRLWMRELDYIFVFTNDQLKEVSVSIPRDNIEWVTSVLESCDIGDRFRIDNPCDISIDVINALSK